MSDRAALVLGAGLAHDRDRLLNWAQVGQLTGLCRTTAWRMRRAGDFPQPVAISPGRVAWRGRDIIASIQSRGAPAAADA